MITKAQLKNDTKSFVVVLDAGHGGKDPGRPTSYGYKEKDIALDIVLKVGKNLESVPGVSVIYTRKTDIFLELRERATIANKADADLFVSVHCNAHDSQAHGTETYVLGLHRNDSNFKVAQKENEVIFLDEEIFVHRITCNGNNGFDRKVMYPFITQNNSKKGYYVFEGAIYILEY